MVSSLPAGSRLLAEDILPWSDAINGLITPTETDWSASVAWTSSGSAPALGNATKAAKYYRTSGGLWVDVYMKLTFGTTSTFGTGVYFFALPVTAASNQTGTAIGTCYGINTGTAEYGATVKLESTTTVRLLSETSNWGQTSPFTWGNTDIISFTVRYRAA